MRDMNERSVFWTVCLFEKMIWNMPRSWDVGWIYSWLCSSLILFLVFKDNIAGGFFSRKLNFVQRLWQIAAAAQNGLVRCDLCQVRAV